MGLMCQKYRDLYKESVEKGQTCDRLKLLILMCQEDDDETRLAAAGAMAMLTTYEPDYCKKVREIASTWELSINIITFDQSPAIRHRGLSLLQNISENCIETAEHLSKTDLKEILIGMSRDLES